MRPQRIAFMTTVGRNVGDEFIREGIRSFFDDIFGSYEPYYVDKHDLTTLHRRVYDEAETLADKFQQSDIIVQAGAPVYWNNGKFKSYNDTWSRALWFDRIFKLGNSRIVLNLGAGAGQKSEDDLETLLSDPQLIEFAQQAGAACRWTTTRDPLAAEFLNACNVAHELLPCPAFHAARRFGIHESPPPHNGLLAVNLMPKAGHYRLKPETNETHWRDVIDKSLLRLRAEHRLIFVAHDETEAQFAAQFAHENESVFQASDYRDYIAFYGRVKGIVANRVHGAICVAGFGRPAVIVGNDARIGIARPIGIPAIDSAEASAEWIVDALHQQLDNADKLARRRLSLREESAWRYVQQITQIVQQHRDASLAA
jgi:hypothetical protein